MKDSAILYRHDRAFVHVRLRTTQQSKNYCLTIIVLQLVSWPREAALQTWSKPCFLHFFLQPNLRCPWTISADRQAHSQRCRPQIRTQNVYWDQQHCKRCWLVGLQQGANKRQEGRHVDKHLRNDPERWQEWWREPQNVKAGRRSKWKPDSFQRGQTTPSRPRSRMWFPMKSSNKSKTCWRLFQNSLQRLFSNTCKLQLSVPMVQYVLQCMMLWNTRHFQSY